ncbi:MAG: hypothetical protein ACLFOY_13295 [Desulfatibacillaceae bacterium]
MTSGKLPIQHALKQSLEQLHQSLEQHQRIIAAAIEHRDQAHVPADLAPPTNGPEREARLKAAIVEAIDVLDQSRKAFKSKQLEALRKHLTNVLAGE